MIGKIIGAIVGARAAKRPGGVSETGGAVLGAGTAALLRRMSPLGLVALAAGGYALKRYNDRRRNAAAREKPKVRPSAT